MLSWEFQTNFMCALSVSVHMLLRAYICLTIFECVYVCMCTCEYSLCIYQTQDVLFSIGAVTDVYNNIANVNDTY